MRSSAGARRGREGDRRHGRRRRLLRRLRPQEFRELTDPARPPALGVERPLPPRGARLPAADDRRGQRPRTRRRLRSRVLCDLRIAAATARSHIPRSPSATSSTARCTSWWAARWRASSRSPAARSTQPKRSRSPGLGGRAARRPRRRRRAWPPRSCRRPRELLLRTKQKIIRRSGAHPQRPSICDAGDTPFARKPSGSLSQAAETSAVPNPHWP